MEELKNIAPSLNALKRKNSFEVPENYFEELPYSIQEKCISKQSERKVVSALFWKLCIPLSIVAIALVIFMPLQTNKVSIASTQEMSAYLEQELDSEIDESMVQDAYSFEKENVNSNNKTQNIEDYLIENDVDESLLTEEI